MSEYRTDILSNGSKWAGEDEDPIEELFRRLAENTLDPRLEKYGRFISRPKWIDPNCEAAQWAIWVAFGNFWDVSGVFNILTNDPGLAKKLRKAIRANMRKPSYAVAKAEAGL